MATVEALEALDLRLQRDWLETSLAAAEKAADSRKALEQEIRLLKGELADMATTNSSLKRAEVIAARSMAEAQLTHLGTDASMMNRRLYAGDVFASTHAAFAELKKAAPDLLIMRAEMGRVLRLTENYLAGFKGAQEMLGEASKTAYIEHYYEGTRGSAMQEHPEGWVPNATIVVQKEEKKAAGKRVLAAAAAGLGDKSAEQASKRRQLDERRLQEEEALSSRGRGGSGKDYHKIAEARAPGAFKGQRYGRW